MAVPSAGLRSEAARIGPHLPPGAVLLSVTKGLERGSLLRLSPVLAQEGPAASDRIAGPFRLYTNRDIVGVELCGALKNIVAIAAGAADRLGFGDNGKAGLITRGLAEMTRLGIAAGANPLTFAGLARPRHVIAPCRP